MPFTPNTVVVTTGGIHGRCWFAARDIKAGEVVWYSDIDQCKGSEEKGILVFTRDELQAMDPTERQKFFDLAYQVGEDLFNGFASDLTKVRDDVLVENFVNHCCDGNVWYQGDDYLVAIRDIRAGEEIAYDYVFHEGHEWFELDCLCGKALCRGRVTGNDWKLPELQQRYKGHFMAHITRMIEAHNAQMAKLQHEQPSFVNKGANNEQLQPEAPAVRASQ